MREALQILAQGNDLTEETAEAAMFDMMDGRASPAQIAAYLTLLRQKGETVAELTGSARAMRDRALAVNLGRLDVVDTCGTGGDGAGTFNISTAAAIVAAAAGAAVAKHGNRAASGKTGSADVLAALGVAIEIRPESAADCVRDAGICFLFAQSYHPAMRHVAPIRKELGYRTMFNFLGPLTNPARPKRQVLGTPDRTVAEKMARVLAALGTRHALVVHADSGMDEIALDGPTEVFEVREGAVASYRIEPSDLGLRKAPREAVLGGEPEENAAIIRRVFSGAPGPARDIVTANAAAALYVAGLSGSLREGARKAEAAIDSGRATGTLERLAEVSNRFQEGVGA